MSKKILSRKWDVWQERLGWEGNSHLLWKMCPESLVKIYSSLLACQMWSDDGNVQNALVNFVWQRIVFVSQQVTAPGGDIRPGSAQGDDDNLCLDYNPEVGNWLSSARNVTVTRDRKETHQKELIVCRAKRLEAYERRAHTGLWTLRSGPRLTTNIWSWAESNVYLANRWGNCLYDLNTNKDDRFGIQPPAIYTLPCKQPLLASTQQKVFLYQNVKQDCKSSICLSVFFIQYASWIFGLEDIVKCNSEL